MGEKRKTPNKADSHRKESCRKCRQETGGRTGRSGNAGRSARSEKSEKRAGKSGKKDRHGDAEVRTKSDTQCCIRDPGRREALQKAAEEIRLTKKAKRVRGIPDACIKGAGQADCPRTVRGAQQAQRQADREERDARRVAAMAYERERRHKRDKPAEQVGELRPLRYLALGDSITTGTNNGRLKGVSYSDHISSRLIERYGEKNVSYRKSVTPGYTVRDLYRVMESYLPEIRAADFITISIGGNDLLGAGRDSGYAAIDMKKARAGMEGIKRYLPRLVDRLKEVGGEDGRDARILIMNLYNPYCRRERGLVIPSDGGQVPLYDAVQGLLLELDGVIHSVCGPNVIRVDTAAAFEAPGRFGSSHGGPALAPHLEKRTTCEDGYTHFYDYPYSRSITTLFLKNTRDPHPTDLGHRTLAEAHWNVMEPLLP